MRRFRPTDPATAALGGHQTSTVLCDPPPADRPGAIGGAAAPPLFGAPLAAPPIPGPDQFMRKPGAGPRVWPPWTPGSTHGAHTDPPAAFLRATARPAADVRPAPRDPAPNFCPSTTGEHGLGSRLGTWSWRANTRSIAGIFGGARVVLPGIEEGQRAVAVINVNAKPTVISFPTAHRAGWKGGRLDEGPRLQSRDRRYSRRGQHKRGRQERAARPAEMEKALVRRVTQAERPPPRVRRPILFIADRLSETTPLVGSTQASIRPEKREPSAIPGTRSGHRHPISRAGFGLARHPAGIYQGVGSGYLHSVDQGRLFRCRPFAKRCSGTAVLNSAPK